MLHTRYICGTFLSYGCAFNLFRFESIIDITSFQYSMVLYRLACFSSQFLTKKKISVDFFRCTVLDVIVILLPLHNHSSCLFVMQESQQFHFLRIFLYCIIPSSESQLLRTFLETVFCTARFCQTCITLILQINKCKEYSQFVTVLSSFSVSYFPRVNLTIVIWLCNVIFQPLISTICCEDFKVFGRNFERR